MKDIRRTYYKWLSNSWLLLACIALVLVGLSTMPHVCPSEMSGDEFLVGTSVFVPSDGGSIDDEQARQRAIIKTQHDMSDAILTYRSGAPTGCENVYRGRRMEFSRRLSLLNTRSMSQPAVQQHIASSMTHRLNSDIASSRVLPLNLPPEEISFPFHSFW